MTATPSTQNHHAQEACETEAIPLVSGAKTRAKVKNRPKSKCGNRPDIHKKREAARLPGPRHLVLIAAFGYAGCVGKWVERVMDHGDGQLW